MSTRMGHSVTSISLVPGFIEVTMFGGGSFTLYDGEVQKIAATTVMTFSESHHMCMHIP